MSVKIGAYSLLVLVLSTVVGATAREKRDPSNEPTLSVDIEEFPSTVMIVHYDNDRYELVCTGSLLTLEWVLTAGQCLYYKNEHYIHVCAGYSAMTDLLNLKHDATNCKQAWNKKPHPRYGGCCGQDHDDLALIKVREAFKLTDKVKPVKLAISPMAPNKFHECYVAGYCRPQLVPHSDYNCSWYGYRSNYYSYDYCFQVGENTLTSFENTFLRRRPVSVTRRCPCNLKMPWWEKSKEVRAPFMCYNEIQRPLSTRQFCQGDQGAGLICQEMLYGVLTTTLGKAYSDTCVKKAVTSLNGTYYAEKVGPMTVVFANPCSHIRWINEYVKLHSPQELRKGGCDEEEDRFEKVRDKLKDPESEYWEYENNQKRPPIRRRQRKDEEDEEDDAATRAESRNLLLVLATVVLLTLFRGDILLW